MFQQEVPEAYYFVLEKPTVNKQLQPHILNLFRNSVVVLQRQ